jgi:hypothetical protein
MNDEQKPRGNMLAGYAIILIGGMGAYALADTSEILGLLAAFAALAGGLAVGGALR